MLLLITVDKVFYRLEVVDDEDGDLKVILEARGENLCHLISDGELVPLL